MSRRVDIKQSCIDIKSSPNWEVVDTGLNAAAIGYAFLGSNYLDAKGLATLFSRDANLDFKRFAASLKELNGNFAVIVKGNNAVFAAVDRIRSYPLFYSAKEGTFLISDNAYGIRDRLHSKSLDSSAINEFLMSGYVSGNRTLFSPIKQLMAGEAIYFSRENAAVEEASTERYYTYYERNKMSGNIGEMINIYDKVLKATFQRLIKSVQGRKIVIPLSGGVDSRLLACMIKDLGYTNVSCLSYGIPGNWETAVSRKAAKKLGYDWIYIPYSRKKWRDAYRSREWADFFYSADNLSSLPNMSDWLAVKEMKEKNMIPDDAVFAPGHTGDFISGGHLLYAFGEKKEITRKELLDSMMDKHYGLWKKDMNKPQVKGHIVNKLNEFVESLTGGHEKNLADVYECWEWQERQAKFIVNAARSYDYWGYDWRLPFWDSEYIDFWSKVPFEMKLHKKLYLTYLRDKNKSGLFGDDMQRKELARRKRFKGLQEFVDYFRDISGMYGMYGYFTVTFFNRGRRSINSVLVRDYIDGVRKNMGLLR